MDDKLFAKQLRKPTGNIGKHVGNVMNDINLFMNSFTFKSMNIKNNDRILEVGFGNGKFIQNILEKAENVTYKGIELSEIMIEEAIIRNQPLINSGIVDLKLANVYNIPFEKETFDKVVTINTIYFFENIDAAIKEISRVLIKNGSLCITIRTKEKFQNVSFSQYLTNLFDYSELESILLSNGFENIKKEYCIEPNSENKLDVLCILANKRIEV